MISLDDIQFRVPVMQGFWKKYCPKRSEGAEIFFKTRRAPTLQDNGDTELLLPNEISGCSGNELLFHSINTVYKKGGKWRCVKTVRKPPIPYKICTNLINTAKYALPTLKNVKTKNIFQRKFYTRLLKKSVFLYSRGIISISWLNAFEKWNGSQYPICKDIALIFISENCK